MQGRRSATHSTVANGHNLALLGILMATEVCVCTQKQFTSVSLLHSQFEINVFKEYLSVFLLPWSS